MIEHEKTYLLARLPDGLEECEHKEITDIYYPKDSNKPKLRLRRSGERCELTKKVIVDDDASQQEEHTVPLTREEFQALSEAPGKKVEKTRYYYPFQGRTAEIDVFGGDLRGLAVTEFEFEDENDKKYFERPDFCLAEVTYEDFIAGGQLAGASYEDLKGELSRFSYQEIRLTTR